MSSRLPMGSADEMRGSRRSLWIGLACGEFSTGGGCENCVENFGTAVKQTANPMWSAGSIERELSPLRKPTDLIRNESRRKGVGLLRSR